MESAKEPDAEVKARADEGKVAEGVKVDHVFETEVVASSAVVDDTGAAAAKVASEAKARDLICMTIKMGW